MVALRVVLVEVASGEEGLLQPLVELEVEDPEAEPRQLVELGRRARVAHGVVAFDQLRDRQGGGRARIAGDLGTGFEQVRQRVLCGKAHDAKV